jgi:hypothetical protein
VHGEHALDADAEGLLADGERLAGPVPLALDDDPLEHLHSAASALDHLEMHLHAVARPEGGTRRSCARSMVSMTLLMIVKEVAPK